MKAHLSKNNSFDILLQTTYIRSLKLTLCSTQQHIKTEERN